MSGPNGKLTEEHVKAELAGLAAERNGLGPAKDANGQAHDLTAHRQGAAGVGETAGQGGDRATAGQDWPTLGQAAFHGLAGRVVRTLEPHTEADPAGLLVCFLAAFGNIVGAGPHASADASKHPARLNVLLVGKTAKARKGTAWANDQQVMALADPGWAMECVVSGLSSGEGLIAEVRDPGEDQLAGVQDKRRLVVEAEFARVLNMTARDGNILSAVIRDAWDHGRLRTMTRFDPLRATGAHISILGQITAEELVRKLSDVESANGFANRFLFCCVCRSKYLPDGGRLDRDELEGLAGLVGRAAQKAAAIGPMHRSAAASVRWGEVYRDLAEGGPGGLAGLVTARAEAQTLRLSVAYALLDGSPVIEIPHLEAALAVWRYCEASALYLFGDKSGDDIADRLLLAVRAAGEAGLTTTEQNRLFSGHATTRQLDVTRQLLQERGLIVTEQQATKGRPRLVSKAVQP